MDVTPRELRDSDIREAWRGYHRDDVDELLERAAASLESLTERARQLSERIAAAEGDATKGRETQDIIQRTLVLAQRAADDAIAEAQAEAKRLVSESETKVRTLVADAEIEARRVAESERRRLEAEVIDLGARRDALVADVAALEQFESAYRARIRSALEADLATVAGREPAAPSPRPALHDISLPPTTERIVVTRPESGVVPGERVVSGERVVPSSGVAADHEVDLAAAETPAPTPAEAPAPKPPERSDSPGAADDRLPAPEAPPPAAPAAPPPESPAPDWGPIDASGASAGGALFDAEEPVGDEVLDDDAFFASLREAVRDDSPLGPRDDAPFYEDDAEESRRGVFRRRR